MTLHCQQLESRLSQIVDRTLGDADAREVRAHLDGCASCRGIVRDLERVRDAGRDLGPMAPPAHVWLQIAGHIHAGDPSPASAATRRPSFVPWLGLAAALVLITLGVYVVTILSPEVPPQGPAIAEGNPAGSDPVETAVAELQKAATHYENAMLELDRLAQTNDGSIDPRIATLLRDQLAAADRAITESRQAMAAEPTSQPARESLFEAFRRKVSVLQATVSLMNEMRQGNPDGAAKAASSLNKKG